MGRLSRLIEKSKGERRDDAFWFRAWQELKKKEWEDDAEHNDSWYHPSSLMGCPALLFLKIEGFPIPREPYDDKKARVFNLGDSIHERIQIDLIRAGVLDTQFFDHSQETPVCSEEWHIRGHTDGLLDSRGKLVKGETQLIFGKECPVYEFPVDMSGKSILEVKSIKGDDDLPPSRQKWGFNSVAKKQKPKDEHILQASIYAWLLDVPTITFLYENKNTQDWYFITVERDMSVVQMVQDKITLVEAWRKEYRRTGKIPKQVYAVAKESYADRKPFGLHAHELLRRRVGQPTLEEQHQKVTSARKRLVRRKK